MQILRTPDERFQNLPGFPYAPHYTDVPSGDGGTLRIAHVEAGPADGPVVLLMHGEPSWSFLYRKMIPVFADAGFHVYAPDLVGFGRSDKPAAQSDYTYQRHVDWMAAWLATNGLRGITLFCQDWGGLIGLRLVAQSPDLFDRVIASNTFLPNGLMPLGSGFTKWRDYAATTPVFHVGGIVKGGTALGLSDEVIAAYDAPYPDDTYKAGARVFPTLVPASPEDPDSPVNVQAWEVLAQWNKPFLTLFGDSDKITRGAEQMLQALIPGTQGQPHQIIEKGGHFIQEDQGEKLAALCVEWIRKLG